MQFGDALRAAMDSRGYSCRTLAEAIDVSLATIKNWTSGDNPPKSLEVVVALSEVLVCEFVYSTRTGWGCYELE
jgi:transcriptional regulator with XRE-family HTH domain